MGNLGELGIMWRGLFSGTKVRRQQSQRRQKFLQGLSLERLESRQLLYGVTDTPHGAAPGHDLGDTITADVLIYTNGSLVDLPPIWESPQEKTLHSYERRLLEVRLPFRRLILMEIARLILPPNM